MGICYVAIFYFLRKNEAEPPEENTNNEEIILDNGNIGLVIDTREIAKKGYKQIF